MVVKAAAPHPAVPSRCSRRQTDRTESSWGSMDGMSETGLLGGRSVPGLDRECHLQSRDEIYCTNVDVTDEMDVEISWKDGITKYVLRIRSH